jgi:uncharacterized protein (DUF1800 family)
LQLSGCWDKIRGSCFWHFGIRSHRRRGTRWPLQFSPSASEEGELVSQNVEVQKTWSADDVRHLLGRVEFAAMPRRVEALSELTPSQAVEQLLVEAKSAPLPAAPAWVREPWVNTERRYADSSPDEMRGKHGATNRRYREEIEDLRRWWFEQMLTSGTPIREVMTLFWHSHFASSIGKVLVSQAMYDQNARQRCHALGNFRELLGEMTRDAAMMIYLDLEDSDRQSPNENYARELFELFALGIGNYSQADIREAARALTGWKLDAPPGTALPGRPTEPQANRRFTRDGLVARLDPDCHDSGIKTLFGTTGPLGLDEVIELTVSHPACGSFLAGKLIAYFAVPDPSGELQRAMAKRFVESDCEISPMLAVLLSSQAFYSGAARATLIKSPLHLMVGSCRVLQVEAEFTPELNRYLAAMGQELFSPPNVKGWPGGEAWIGSGTLALRYHLPDVILNAKSPPGMAPIGRDRGRPIPLPSDPQQRAAMIRQIEQGDMTEMGMVAGGRAPGAAPAELRINFSVSRFIAATFPAGIVPSSAEVASAVLERMLGRIPRQSLLAAAENAAGVDGGQDIGVAVTNVIRLTLSSPDYQLT